MTIIYQVLLLYLNKQFGLSRSLRSLRQERFSVSSVTQCTPLSFNKSFDLISTANLMRKHSRFYLRVAGIWFNHAYMKAMTVQGRWVLENSDIFFV